MSKSTTSSRKSKANAERKLNRIHFKTSRVLDYLTQKELTAQTGHGPKEWPLVILKELVDNSLDACEEQGTLPEISVRVDCEGITVTDNGPGIPKTVVENVLDFNHRISSREAYVAPDRGAQGNALKTLFCMPFALSGAGGVVVESFNQRHEISVVVDQIKQSPSIDLKTTRNQFPKGTSIFVNFCPEKASFANPTKNVGNLQNCKNSDPNEASFILERSKSRFLQLAQSFVWINPHLSLSIDWFDDKFHWPRTTESISKWTPSSPTDPHWYCNDDFFRLVAAHINHGTKTIREFVAEFKGFSSTRKTSSVLQEAGFHRQPFKHLVRQNEIDKEKCLRLLKAMKKATKPTNPLLLGEIGKLHFESRFSHAGADMDSFKYKRVARLQDNVPFVIESAFSYLPNHESRHSIFGVNWSPGIQNPFRQLGESGPSLEGLLGSRYLGQDEPILFVLHVISPRIRFADRGKSTLVLEDA